MKDRRKDAKDPNIQDVPEKVREIAQKFSKRKKCYFWIENWRKTNIFFGKYAIMQIHSAHTPFHVYDYHIEHNYVNIYTRKKNGRYL